MRATRTQWIAIAVLACFAAPAAALDVARTETGVDRAIKQFGLSGKGVLIAVMDRGIDHTHPALRHPDGSTRIVGMLDLTDDTGAQVKQHPHKFGTTYTEAKINAALAGDLPLPTQDEEGRGTASTGIACGNGAGSHGAGSTARPFRGVAPDAQILFIKLKADPSPWDPAPRQEERRFIDRVPSYESPAPDGAPQQKPGPKPKPAADAAEAPGPDAAKQRPQSAEQFFGLERLQVAVDYCLTQAKARKLPCVMLMNFAQMGGPTDGSSKLCQMIDRATGPGIPGLVLVTGTSDKGDRENRTRGLLQQDQVSTLHVDKEAHGEVFVDVWYPGVDRVDVRITTPKGTFGPYNAPKWALGKYERGFQLYHFAAVRSTHRPASGKRQIRVDLIGPPGRYVIELYGAIIKSPGGGRFDAFVAPNPENPLQDPFNKFIDPKAPPRGELDFQDPEKVGLHGSIWDGATAKHAIAVACYVHRTDWKNVQGRDLTQLSEGKHGAIWRGSGRGPTADGRPGVTLAVPGDRMAAPYGRKSEWATSVRNILSDQANVMYGVSSGTTASASFLAGVVALMFERNPSLDAAQIKTLLTRNARQDVHTGTTPNRTWGHGKLDAYAAIAGAK